MAYKGIDEIEKAYYEKLIEAGFSSDHANLLARLDTSHDGRGRVTSWERIRKEGFLGLRNYLKSKM